MSATKAGKRHSTKDQAAIQLVHDKAIELGADCGAMAGEQEAEAKVLSLDLRVEAVRSALWHCWCAMAPYYSREDMIYTPLNIYDDHAIVRLGNVFYRVNYQLTDGEVIVTPRDQWIRVEQDWTPSAEVKALGEDRVGAYVVLFGDEDHPDLSSARDFFTKNTDFWLDKWAKRPMLYNHDMSLPDDFEPVVGSWQKFIPDDIGIWAEGELEKAHKYRAMVKRLIDQQALATSSDSAPHLVKRKPASKGTHEITRWPLLAASLTTTPAEPRLLPVTALKSAYETLGIDIQGIDIQLDATGEASTATATGATAQDVERTAREAAIKSLITNLEESSVEPQTIQEFLAAAKTAVLAGNLDVAEKYTKQAQALKAIEDAEVKTAAPVTVAKSVQRLPFSSEPSAVEEPAPQENVAVKTWFTRKFGTLETGVEQVAKELYNSDYQHTTWAKNVDFRRYLKTGHFDPRLQRVILLTPEQIVEAVASGVLVSEVKATMIEGSDTLGGYIVPEDFRTGIIQRLPGLTVVRPLANVITTSSDRVLMPKATGGSSRYTGAVRVTWVDEAPTAGASATNSTWGQVPIPIHTVMAKTSLGRNLVEDAAFDVAFYLQDQFATAMSIDEDEQFLVGSGAGRPQGVLNGTAASGAPFDSDVTTVVSGSAAALTADKIKALPYALPAQYRQSGAVWVGTKDTVLAIKQLKDSQNNYLWADRNQQMRDGTPERLEGYLFRESEAMPAIAANKYPLIFGNFKSGYTIADRIGMSIERYMDSTTADTNSIVFYARRRLGGQVTAGWAFAVQKCST